MATIDHATIHGYLLKLRQIEDSISEIRKGLTLFDEQLGESIERGEQDIKAGRVMVCKSKNDLDEFFASL